MTNGDTGKVFYLEGVDEGSLPLLFRILCFHYHSFLGEFDGALFFGGERIVFCFSRNDGFGIDAPAFAREEGRDNKTGITAVEESDAEALIAAGILKGIKADDADSVDAGKCQAPNIL